MAWTSPKVWATGELVTAAMMNTYVSDNDTYLFGEVAVADRVMDEYVTTTSTSGYSHSSSEQFILCCSTGDVQILLATSTSSSTGKMTTIKNYRNGTTEIDGQGVGIEGSTSCWQIASTGNTITLYRAGSSDWWVL